MMALSPKLAFLMSQSITSSGKLETPASCRHAGDVLIRCHAEALRCALATGAVAETIAVSFHCNDWEWLLDAACSVLSPQEQARADRQRRTQDRQMHMLAYALHRLTAAQVMQMSPLEVPLIRDDKGCPRLPGTPWHTSLSHADGSIAVAMSAEGPVGIDLEARHKAHLMPELAGLVCTPAEHHRMTDVPGAPDQSLLELWVRKEALLKACGLGMALEMTTIDAPADRWLALPGDGRLALIQMLSLGPDHVAALASVSRSAALTVAWLSPRMASAAG